MTRQFVQHGIAHRQQDGDLIEVRDKEWLAAMPESDRECWRELWADVNALLEQVERVNQQRREVAVGPDRGQGVAVDLLARADADQEGEASRGH